MRLRAEAPAAQRPATWSESQTSDLEPGRRSEEPVRQ